MEFEEIAHQCQLSLSRSFGSVPLPSQALFLIESFLRQQGVPARLNGGSAALARR